MKKLSKILILLVSFAFPISAQNNKNNADNWWVNIPTSPVIFDFEPVEKSHIYPDENNQIKINNRQYFFGFRNLTSKGISEYSTGCVVKRGSKFKVVKNLFVSVASDGGFEKNGFWIDGIEHLNKSLCRNSKIAVTKVEFWAGGRWRIPSKLLIK